MTDPKQQRSIILKQLAQEHFDLLIIGGGITGAGIALDASYRGLKTALIEKNDFASGTSSRSTKLIHGGLRYLKQFEFALVKEVGSERAIVHQLAPHLVVSEKMLLPLKEGRGFGSTLTSFGLKLYDWLAGVKPEDKRIMLTRKRTLEREPLLKAEGVKGGGLYSEYRTDDARLTIEIMKTAISHGATVANYVQSGGFMYDEGRIHGVLAMDTLTGQSLSIKAKCIVNATGPWVDTLRTLDNSKRGKQLHLTKGVHIVVPRSRFPVKQSIYFDVPDGRMIFAIPRGKTTYIGTTDTDYKGSIDHVVTTKEDAQYLIEAVNDSFPSVNLTLKDIESSWAGLRPLIHEEGRSASELSRKDEIFESSSGLLSIGGGKLTGYRRMAERVVNMVIDKHFKTNNLRECHTSEIKLTGADFRTSKDVKEYSVQVAEKLRNYGLEQYTEYLVHNYGRQTELIIAHFMSLQTNDAEINLARAELWFTINHEMVQQPSDFFIRRTGMLFFSIQRMSRLIEPVLFEFKNYFGWSPEKISAEREILEQLIEEVQLKIE